MENPEYLIGIPLVLLAALGLLAAFSLFALPADGAVASERLALPRGKEHAGAHPQPTEYIIIGMVLAFITAVEVALYYIDLNRQFLITILLILSTAKFVFVVAWFMHLKFDNRILTVAFAGGFFLAAAVFAVVLMSLNAGLV